MSNTPQVGDAWKDASTTFRIAKIEGRWVLYERGGSSSEWGPLSWFDNNPFATLIERDGKAVE